MSHERGTYPIDVWDGLSKNQQRQTRHDEIVPNPEDWNRITSEVIVTQEHTSFVTTEGRVEIKSLPGSDLKTLQDHINSTSSSGRIVGGTVTDAGGSRINITAGVGLIRDLTTERADLFHFNWPEVLGIPVPLNTTTWVVVKFRGTLSPQFALNFNADTITHTDEFALAVVTNDGGDIHVHELYDNALNNDSRMVERFFETLPMARDERLGGILLNNVGTRNLTLSPGAIWEKLTRFVIDAQDTSGSDTFDTFRSDGFGGLTKTTGVTQWPNTVFDDGAGNLVTLGNNRCANLFFYIEVDNDLVMLYGAEQHNTLVGALAEASPTVLPAQTKDGGRLIARLVFEKDSDTPDTIVSAFAQV